MGGSSANIVRWGSRQITNEIRRLCLRSLQGRDRSIGYGPLWAARVGVIPYISPGTVQRADHAPYLSATIGKLMGNLESKQNIGSFVDIPTPIQAPQVVRRNDFLVGNDSPPKRSKPSTVCRERRVHVFSHRASARQTSLDELDLAKFRNRFPDYIRKPRKSTSAARKTPLAPTLSSPQQQELKARLDTTSMASTETQRNMNRSPIPPPDANRDPSQSSSSNITPAPNNSTRADRGLDATSEAFRNNIDAGLHSSGDGSRSKRATKPSRKLLDAMSSSDDSTPKERNAKRQRTSF